jgi:hypothetical protein
VDAVFDRAIDAWDNPISGWRLRSRNGIRSGNTVQRAPSSVYSDIRIPVVKRVQITFRYLSENFGRRATSSPTVR